MQTTGNALPNNLTPIARIKMIVVMNIYTRSHSLLKSMSSEFIVGFESGVRARQGKSWSLVEVFKTRME